MSKNLSPGIAATQRSAPSLAIEVDAAPGDPLIVAGFTKIPNSNVWARTVVQTGEDGSRKKLLFNVKEFGKPAQYRGSLSVSFFGRVTGAPSVQLGDFETKVQMLDAVNTRIGRTMPLENATQGA